MDSQINELIQKLDDVNHVYPNLTNIWKHYIRKRYRSFINDIVECNNIIDILNQQEVQDLNIIQMVLLSYIRQEQHNINN